MKSSDSRTNSKYKSPYGCRTNSQCVISCTTELDMFGLIKVAFLQPSFRPYSAIIKLCFYFRLPVVAGQVTSMQKTPSAKLWKRIPC